MKLKSTSFEMLAKDVNTRGNSVAANIYCHNLSFKWHPHFSWLAFFKVQTQQNFGVHKC